MVLDSRTHLYNRLVDRLGTLLIGGSIEFYVLG